MTAVTAMPTITPTMTTTRQWMTMVKTIVHGDDADYGNADEE